MRTAAIRAGVAMTIAVLVTLHWATAPRARAQEKTEVGVTFELTDPRYTDEFRDENIPDLKAEVATAIAGALDDKIRFLDFSTNQEASYRLTVHLGRAERSQARGPAEFGFHLLLTGPEVREDATHYLVFRTKDQYSSPIGDRSALVREIELKLKQADHHELVRGVLRHVAMAEDGDFYRRQRQVGWIVHRNRAALCVDRDSRLVVLNAFQFLGQKTHHPFEARVLDVDRPDGGIVSIAVSSKDPEMIDELKETDPLEVEVERVFLIEYRRFCRQPVRGDEVDFSQEGGAR